jgi:photosystem II stability/assembly factor-like uncharacterized protein
MKLASIVVWGGAALLGCAVQAQAEPLQRPARLSPMAVQRLVTGVAPAGPQRLVAVGQRGHILLSEDGGAQWAQVPLSVSSDLTAVQFVNAERGYAVGHDGVVLTSADGGRQWSRLLDGRTVNALALEQMKAAPIASADHERLLGELERNVEVGPDKPFFDAHFINADEGFVVGAYNLLLHTRDGGQTWQSWYARSDNAPSLLNLHAVRTHQGRWFIAGEAGLLMRLDAAGTHFQRIDTGYAGSFFGLLDAGEALIAHGMRGNAVISRDGGNSWTPLATGLPASLTASARGKDGRLWLADQIGNVVVSRDGGRQFKPVPLPNRQPVAALHVTEQALVIAGPRGVRSVPLPKE